MKFKVPQYIDVEDKIAFFLTAKQLGWFGLGGVILFIIWNFVTQGFFIFWTVVIGLTSCAFAFYRPYGVPLSSFIKNAFFYMVGPKRYIWRVNPSIIEAIKKNKKVKKEESKFKIKKRPKNLNQIVETLDS